MRFKFGRSSIHAAGEGDLCNVQLVLEQIIDHFDHAFYRHGFLGHHQTALRVGGCQLGFKGRAFHLVLWRAIADALLGAAGLPDIGYWFPPGDPACKDIPSLDIVAKAVSLIRERGGRIVNVDSSLIAESPRISPYLEQMKGDLGTALGISPVRVGIKATTNEQLGALGRREGIAAFAVAAILMPEDLAML